MEIFLGITLVVILGNLIAAGIIDHRRRLKPSGPHKLQPVGLTLAPGYSIDIQPSSTLAYHTGAGKLEYISLVDEQGFQVGSRVTSWQRDRKRDIESLLSSGSYVKRRKSDAVKVARNASTYRVELRADRDEADRMQVGEGGELVIAPARSFHLPKIKPDYGWSIRTENGATRVVLTYRPVEQVLSERVLDHDARSKEKAILESAIEALAEAVVKYGIDPYPQKTSGPYSDFDGDY